MRNKKRGDEELDIIPEGWGYQFKEICHLCGTLCGGTEGQSVWREREILGGSQVICGECDDRKAT